MRWTEEEIQFLKNNWKKISCSIIAKKLDRTERAVTNKRMRCKLMFTKKWKKEEIDFLKNNYSKVFTKELVTCLNRTVSAIRKKCYELKLNGWTVEKRKRCGEQLLGRKLSEQHKLQISETKKEAYKNGMKPFMLGKHHSKESNEKNRKAHLGIFTKEKASNWRGGIYPSNMLIRRSERYKQWMRSVFERDNFICQNPNCKYCNNKKGIYLEAHHIIPFSECMILDWKEEIFDIDNGISYCKGYHKYKTFAQTSTTLTGDEFR